MTGRKNAFTLVEVLVSVAITGLVASLAFVPVAYVVRQVTETEAAYSSAAALRRAAALMAQDAAAGLRLARTPVRVVNHDVLGGGQDDALIAATSAPAKQNLAAGSVVYRLVRRSLFSDGAVPGLYRWLLPGVLPESADYGALDAKDGQLVLPGADGMSLSVFDPPEWVSDYGGKIPAGMKIVLSRESGGDEVEYVVALPR